MLNIPTQRKKAVTLIGFGQKEILIVQRNQHLSFKYMYLREIIFVTDACYS